MGTILLEHEYNLTPLVQELTPYQEMRDDVVVQRAEMSMPRSESQDFQAPNHGHDEYLRPISRRIHPLLFLEETRTEIVRTKVVGDWDVPESNTLQRQGYCALQKVERHHVGKQV
jgi:hypothetical protein